VPSLVDTIRFFDGSGVVVHQAVGDRIAVRIDEQDRPRRAAQRRPANGAGRDVRKGGTAGAGEGVPPVLRRLLVTRPVAVAGERTRRGCEDNAAIRHRHRARALSP
jgi:hypothetical protein